MNKHFNFTQDKNLGLSTVITIIIVVVALIAGTVGGYYWQKQKNEDKNNATVPTDDKNSAIEHPIDPAIRLTTKTYENWMYTFRFDMYRPISQYKITELETNSNWKDAVLTIDFAEPTSEENFQDNYGYYLTSEVIVMPTAKWVGEDYYNDTDKTGDIWVAKKIGVSGDYTIAVVNVGGRDNPADLNQAITDGAKGDFINFETFTIQAA